MSQYFPYPFFPDDVPIDISFIFKDEKPAGKHGFLKTEGRKFVFEDGTPAKFWGTNINGAACFPEKDYAEKFARRLAKLGLNIVRLHQMDAEWNTPNIFSFTKGKRFTGRSFDERSMDRLDYLIYCLKKEGIYVYMDLLIYRKFRSDEGVPNAYLLKDCAKPYSTFSRRLIELQKEYCHELWTHQNPYTGLKYCDEPCIVMSEITGECDLFHMYHLVNKDYEEPYQSEFNLMFNEWLKENGIDRRAEDIHPLDKNDEDLLEFKVYIQRKYYREMIDYMRELGVKIPIAGTNWNHSPNYYRTQLECDFLDTHAYFYDWRWGEYDKHCYNLAVTERPDSFLGVFGYMTSANKPTYLSEWDMTWPNERRAESVLYTASVAAFQGWMGASIHTYAYSTRLDRMNILGEEISAQMIGGTPYRQGVFATWNDPAKFGLFYHAALITRRGDVKEGDVLYGADAEDLKDWDYKYAEFNLEKHKFTTSLGMKDGLPVLPKQTDEKFMRSDTGELFRDWENNIGTIDTPMTKCAYGKLEKNGKIDLSGVSIKCDTDYAVIAMSSLTDKPICESDNILLTTVGRAQNTETKFAGDLMLDIGKPPVIIESIRAEIEIETPHQGMKIWAVSAEGFLIGNVPTEYTEKGVKFKVGDVSQSMYYLVVKD